MMGVILGQSPGMDGSAPRRLFAINVDPSPELPQYAVTPDGQRFLVLDRGERRPDSVHVLLNWLDAAGAPSR